MQQLHFCFDFLREKESLLKKIQRYHTKLICNRDSPLVGEWDYNKYPSVATPKGFNTPFDLTVTLSDNSLNKVYDCRDI